MTCSACPFSHSDTAEQALNWGCLPDEYEIMQIKRNQDKNWTCHDDETKPCAGFVSACRELGLDYKSGEAASYTKWYQTGEA